MKGIKIICMTDIAENSVRTHLIEKKKEPFVKRVMYKKMMEETIISTTPFVFEIMIRDNKLRQLMSYITFKQQIDIMMQQNGCKLQDYTIEEVV